MKTKKVKTSSLFGELHVLIRFRTDGKTAANPDTPERQAFTNNFFYIFKLLEYMLAY
jgi:hypothetical protein